MGDESVKTSGLPQVNASFGNDRLVVLAFANGTGAAQTATVSVTAFMGNVRADVYVANGNSLSANTLIVRNRQTPLDSTSLVVKEGTLFWDASYLYLATSNNHVKRMGPFQDF